MMWKLWKLRRELRKLNGAALWFSSGSDSLLLLLVMLSMDLKFSILRFDEGQTREQRKFCDELIIKYGLRVYAYLPTWSTMVGNGTDMALISGYAVGRRGETTSLVRDIVPGNRCAFDIEMKTTEMINPPVLFENMIMGTKKDESHWVADGKPFLDGKYWTVGSTKFHAPLFNWTQKDVIRGLKSFGTEYVEPTDEQNTGNLIACVRCLKPNKTGETYCPKEKRSIPIVKWSATENWKQWQAAQGV